VTVWTRGALPQTNGTFWLSVVADAITQIGGTALMLLTMPERSFVVTVAYLRPSRSSSRSSDSCSSTIR